MKIALAPAPVPPWRKPFVEQVMEQLRASIQRGLWKSCLPPERVLCKVLEVSRPSLRKAIHRLEDEGFLQTSRGHPTRIRASFVHRPAAPRGNTVVMLCSNPLWAISQSLLRTINEIHRQMQHRECRFECVADQRLKQKDPSAVLRQMVRQYEADHWILASVPFPVQRWFQERKHRSVVLGTTFTGIHLPSVDDDLPAVTRHAAGIFLQLGHRRVVYFARQSEVAGDLASEEAFQKTCEACPHARARIVHHFENADNIRFCLARLLADPQRPTAVLISHPLDVLTVLIHLHARGIRVPREVSLISRFSDDVFDWIEPRPAQYQIDSMRHARFVCKLIDDPSFRGGRVRFIPHFEAGKTLARPPA